MAGRDYENLLQVCVPLTIFMLRVALTPITSARFLSLKVFSSNHITARSLLYCLYLPSGMLTQNFACIPIQLFRTWRRPQHDLDHRRGALIVVVESTSQTQRIFLKKQRHGQDVVNLAHQTIPVLGAPPPKSGILIYIHINGTRLAMFLNLFV